MCIRDRDTSYYPTQYKIVLECGSETGLSKKEGALLLNKITEKYREVFYNNYGYNSSLESAVVSIDYTEYDYVDAVDVFDSSLGSLKNYIDELAASDNTRFRSEKMCIRDRLYWYALLRQKIGYLMSSRN